MPVAVIINLAGGLSNNYWFKRERYPSPLTGVSEPGVSERAVGRQGKGEGGAFTPGNLAPMFVLGNALSSIADDHRHLSINET